MLARRIRGAAPVGARPVARVHDRALQTGRREDALRAQSGDQPSALLAIGGGRSPDRVWRQRALRHQQRQLRRGRLRGPCSVAGDVAGRGGPLLDVEERRAGLAVEHEQPAGLGGLGDCGHDPAIARHVHEHRLRREVVVPQVVVHGLERPDKGAGRGAQRHHRVGVSVGAGSQAAEEVRARAAGRYEHQIARGVDVEDRPRVAGAGVSHLSRQRAPAPALCARARVERPHDSAARVGVPVVADRRAGDHQVADDRRRRRDLVIGRSFTAGPGSETDGAAVAERRTWCARGRVEGEQSRVDRPREDAPRARRFERGAGVAPRRHPARRHLAVAAGAIDSGVEAPDLVRRSPDRARQCARTPWPGRAGRRNGWELPRRSACGRLGRPARARRCDRSTRPGVARRWRGRPRPAARTARPSPRCTRATGLRRDA